MSHTYDELKHKTVVQLREIAKAEEANHESLKGYTQLNKDHLITALCKALNLPMHVHHEARGIDKAAIKAKIKELKKQRVEALAAHDHAKLKVIRRTIHSFNRRIHAAMV
jgi:transcription initiation factor TFIIIB Brf1 subunit/transcription initiation factor TFIIB